MTDAARIALEEAGRLAPGIGGAPVLRSVSDPSKAISTDLARDWMHRAQGIAGFAPEAAV